MIDTATRDTIFPSKQLGLGLKLGLGLGLELELGLGLGLARHYISFRAAATFHIDRVQQRILLLILLF